MLQFADGECLWVSWLWVSLKRLPRYFRHRLFSPPSLKILINSRYCRYLSQFVQNLYVLLGPFTKWWQKVVLLLVYLDQWGYGQDMDSWTSLLLIRKFAHLVTNSRITRVAPQLKFYSFIKLLQNILFLVKIRKHLVIKFKIRDSPSFWLNCQEIENLILNERKKWTENLNDRKMDLEIPNRSDWYCTFIVALKISIPYSIFFSHLCDGCVSYIDLI